MDGRQTERRLIFCQGRQRNGRSCRNTIGEWIDGVAVLRYAGRVVGDPADITCEKCGQVYKLRERVGEALVDPQYAEGPGLDNRSPADSQAIRCEGRLADGRSCGQRLADLESGRVVFRNREGYEIVDPRSIRCPRCKTVREFPRTRAVDQPGTE